jgi:hypothetical protein
MKEIGPKELQRRQMRERRFDERGGKKTTVAELRRTVAKIKAVPKPKKVKR